MEDLKQQHQFQILLQDNQLDKDMKKALAIMFYASNVKKVNIDKNIIDAEDYLDNNIVENNNLATDWENTDVKLWNYKKNAEKSFKKLFANIYKNNKLVQATIDVKVRDMRKLPRKILKQVKLSIENLEVKNNRLYVQGNIYIPDNKNLRLYLL